MYIPFKNRIGYILSDYNDAIQRANRLNAVREAILNTGSCASSISAIQTEDVCIYLRWLICHFYSQKVFMQALKMIEWLPFQMSIDALSSTNNMAPTSNTANNNTSSSFSNKRSDPSESAQLVNAPRATTFDDLNSNYSQKQQNLSNSTTNILNKNFKLFDNMFLPSQNGLVPRSETLNSISVCKFEFRI